MGAESSAENTPAQAQKFWISMKKGFIGRPWIEWSLVIHDDVFKVFFLLHYLTFKIGRSKVLKDDYKMLRFKGNRSLDCKKIVLYESGWTIQIIRFLGRIKAT